MAEFDRHDQSKNENKNENWINADEFRDLPTSDEHGAFISYFDTMLWVADYLLANGCLRTENFSDPEKWNELNEAESRIRTVCESGELDAWGLKAEGETFGNRLSRLPPEDWARLEVDTTEGQPDDDKQRNGSRDYGQANWKNAQDNSRREIAWTALCFRKFDVLKRWSATPRIKIYFSKQAVKDALIEHLRQNPNSSREEAQTHITAAGHKISNRAFMEIWPDAREGAGLSRFARAGRKRKSPRSTTEST